MFTILVNSLNISLVLMTKEDIDENLKLIWNPDSFVRPGQDFSHYRKFSFFLKLFLYVLTNSSNISHVVLAEKKKLNEEKLGLFSKKYFSRAVSNNKTPYTGNSVVLIHD